MRSASVFIFLTFLLVQSNAENTECPEEYAAMRDSTMCLPDSPNVTLSGVSADDIATILQYHNDKRSTVDPPGTDVFKLVWDDKIAAVAQKWANQCIKAHDQTSRNVPDYPGIQIGQNLAAGYSSWTGGMGGWYKEREVYTYGVQPPNFGKVGHYTQMVSKLAYRVGCGFSQCSPGTLRIYVCNYARGQESAMYPYTKGTQCSACPDNCQDGLCNCGGLMCLNGGSLNINTCTCDCQPLYGGKDCSEMECPPADNPNCGNNYPKEYCEYANVVPICPYMCGMCTKQ